MTFESYSNIKMYNTNHHCPSPQSNLSNQFEILEAHFRNNQFSMNFYVKLK